MKKNQKNLFIYLAITVLGVLFLGSVVFLLFGGQYETGIYTDPIILPTVGSDSQKNCPPSKNNFDFVQSETNPRQNAPIQNLPIQNDSVKNKTTQNESVQNIPVPSISDQDIPVQDISNQKTPGQKDALIDDLRQKLDELGVKYIFNAQNELTELDSAAGRITLDDEKLLEILTCSGFKLRKLRLIGGSLTLKSLSEISRLNELEELFLQETPILDSELPPILVGLPNLTRLTLRRLPNLSDQGIRDLIRQQTDSVQSKKNANLRVLGLIELEITGQTLDDLAMLSSLTALDIRSCGQISPDDYFKLEKLSGLSDLKIGGFALDDSVLKIIERLPHLKYLTLEDAMISESGFSEFLESETGKRLISLELARISALTDQSLEKLVHCRQLRMLSLRDLIVTGEFLTILANSESNIQEEQEEIDKKNGSDSKFSSDIASKNEIKNSSENKTEIIPLKTLRLTKSFLQLDALSAIAQFKMLKDLNLSGSILSDSTSLEAISTLPELTSLNLSETGLQNEMLNPLSRLKKLETLNLSGNPALTDEAWFALKRISTLKSVETAGTAMSNIPPADQELVLQ